MFQGADYQLTRRSVLKASVGAVLGKSVTKLIAGEGTCHTPTCEYVILFWNDGGMSHIDTFDPKPGRPVQGDFRSIKTSVPGIDICEIFPKLAKQMQHIALIRSVTGAADDHGRATFQLKTGCILQDGALAHISAHEPVALQLSTEDANALERYGDNEFGRRVLLARRLVEKGVRFVQVNRGGFDTHIDNFPAMEAHGEVMDPALAALISDLAASGLLKKTMVVMLSEFGRTPKINMQAGRDHHASVFTGLFAGGGVKGGQVIGSSDKDAVLPKDRPVNVSDLHACIRYALGIDSNEEILTPLERPMKLVDKEMPVRELFT